MSLRFPYQLVPVNHPVIPLGGRWVRPRTVLPVTLIGPTDSRLIEAVLDTAADDTVFPEDLAAKIGLDLANAPAGSGAGVGSQGIPVKYVQVTLRLTDAAGQERREWLAWVGFTPAPLPYSLLGFAGCLQFFAALFRGDREEVELTINSFYSGT